MLEPMALPTGKQMIALQCRKSGNNDFWSGSAKGYDGEPDNYLRDAEIDSSRGGA
jgi:hypothetical protein